MPRSRSTERNKHLKQHDTLGTACTGSLMPRLRGKWPEFEHPIQLPRRALQIPPTRSEALEVVVSFKPRCGQERHAHSKRFGANECLRCCLSRIAIA